MSLVIKSALSGTRNNLQNQLLAVHALIAGLDEVGRGPLAGPVVVAAALSDGRTLPEGMNDSKLLNHNSITSLSASLKQSLQGFIIVQKDAAEIDRLNIYQATKRAMLEALDGLNPQPQVAISDAMPLPEAKIEVYDLVKADLSEECVMAASILAKCERDLVMAQYDDIYPQYGFASHKGYPTARHLQALIQYGITPIHRLSYQPVLEALIYHRAQLMQWLEEATLNKKVDLLNRVLKIKRPSKGFCPKQFSEGLLWLRKSVGL